MKSLKSIIKFAFFLAIGLFLLWLTTRSLTREEVKMVQELIFSSNWFYIIICILILILSHYIRALRWRTMILPLGFMPSLWNIFMTVISGFFFNLLFPRLGEVMKCTLLGKYEKIPVDKLIGTMVAERIVDLLCLILVIFLTILIQLDRVWGYTKELLHILSIKFSTDHTLIFIVASLFFVLAILFFYILKKKSNSALFNKIRGLVSGFYEGVLSIRKIPNKYIFIFQTLAIWFLYLLSIKVGFYAISSLASMGWPASLTILTFGSFAMIATQGGIGAYQLAVQKTLALYGVNAVSGLAFGWLLWTVQTVMLLIAGPACLLLLLLFNKQRRAN